MDLHRNLRDGRRVVTIFHFISRKNDSASGMSVTE